MDGEQAGQNAYDVTKKWVEQNPDMKEKYSIWAKDLGFSQLLHNVTPSCLRLQGREEFLAE